MTQLSDTQALILSAAAQRPERIALPLPESLRGGAAAKVIGAMIAKGFLQLRELGLTSKLPRLACCQAEHANPLLDRKSVV